MGEGPYDVVFIFVGGNDAKSAFIPFYVKTAKGEEEFSLTEKDDGRDSSLFGDLQRIMDHLGPKMNTDFTPKTTKEEEPTPTSTSISKTKEKEEAEAEFPMVVFPMMPPLMIPAFQKVPLL